MSDVSYQKEKDPKVASSALRIEPLNTYGTYIVAGILLIHKIGKLYAYRGKCFVILLRLTTLQAILSCHNVKKVFSVIVFDGASDLRSIQ